MNPSTPPNRPTLTEALDAWKKLLAGRNLSTNLLWIFEENLCFEKERGAQGGFHLGFQTKFTTPPDDALDIAFDHFSESGARIVFYRLGHAKRDGGQSVCVLLCDPWFDTKGEAENYLRRDEWGVSFHTGLDKEIEEITDLSRWLRRVKRGRGFHDLDFCMTLATIDEIKTYGRPLAHYEHFAQTMLNRLRRFLGQPD
jgi:hypothetical protein